MKTRLVIFIVLIYSLAATAANERDTYFFSKVDYQQGLSNSAVLSLFQDNEGLMWFGTYDGVNCWDGKTMEVFRSDFSADKTLSNNVIHAISQADSSCLWISTHLGVNRFSQKTKQIIGSYDLPNDYSVHSNSSGNTWVLASNRIYYYNTNHQNFILGQTPALQDDMSQRAFVTDDGALWLFPFHTGQIQNYSLNTFSADSLSVKLSVSTTNFHSKAIEDIFYQNGVFCFIDCDKDLYMYDISRKSKIYIRNLSSLVQKYGVIKGIVPFYEDIIIAFRANGLIRLRTSKKYEEEIINRNVRIYGLYREPRQGMLWIASDGQGAVIYAKKYSITTNLMLNRMSTGLSRQVRSVMTDKYGGLWFGTKGDGLLHLPDFRNTTVDKVSEAMVYSPEKKQKVSSYIKWDQEFHVYKLVQSRYMDGFWIGTGNLGLFYYSFEDDALRQVEYSSGEPVIEIHGIYEESDSVLYAVTAGVGFYKIILDKKPGSITVRQQKRYRFFHEQQEITTFYPMLADGDSILWLGSREKGLVRFDKRTEEYRVISLKEMLHKSVDDVLSLYRAHDGKMYVGTTSGLVCLTFHGKKIEATYIGREQGLLNDMIHGVLEDGNGLLWLGTNRGLIKYNPKNGASHDYYYTAGVQVGEFSDDAYYQCPYTGSLFFGGIDGLLYLDRKVAVAPEYYPDILLRRLWIGRREVSLGEYYADNGKSLQLNGTPISFSLSFAVPDYLTGEEVEYSFMLEGYDKQWTSFSSINEASYIEVPAGDYVFKVRYKKDVFDTEYKCFSIPVHILPPWYQSVWAYIFYILQLALFVGYLLHLLRKYILHERVLKRLLAAENNKEGEGSVSYNRDLLNSFTLIYHACDQLRAENTSYEQHRKQVELIRETAMAALFRPETLHSEKLNQFYPTTFVLSARMCIQELSMEVLRTLKGQGVDVSLIQSSISENFTFPVYKNAVRCILYYCYQSICQQKLSSTGITVNAKEEEGKMCMMLSAADGVLEKLRSQLIGDACPVSDKKDTDQAFGIQLMLCFVQSALEQLHVTVHYTNSDTGHSCLELVFEPVELTDEKTTEKKTILLLEDRDEMVWLITGLLSEEYSICPVKSVQTAFDEIRRSIPALFLVDMSMYTDAESTFLEYVGKNRSLLSKTAFVPMLTWKASSAIQRELILWSDSYIVLPYDILFLKEDIHRAIYGKREAKQIYLEELGELAQQIVCTTTEQVDFIRKLLQVIEQNLDQEGLGSTFIADRMAMSPRQFYRKFKEISSMSPTDLIKNYRLEKAAQLLREEELTIQDVISDVGISSRSYFYKEFARKFGVTPKDYREQGKDV
ncbi:helix-turn-helix domain-containing protein [Bacteroides faecium]|uniref:Helix-turn-helix domain-containing protein n=1 Tax=Bacteroides faecium TaxID=2715212 RepID=A0A6H0KPS4_9BACE|nr:helix-turn-helix domain-containing protein [Bacteroides faecium]QIU94387.1 helix-turn-helix domain-containing protein [Bacteroides faecium]